MDYKIGSFYKKDWQWQDGDLTVTRACQWSAPGCHQGCSVLYYTDKEGKLVKVEGDPHSSVNQGRLCMRCFALPELANHPDRVIYPLKRVGERGSNEWERVSWDEALDIIKENYDQICEKYGPKSVATFGGTGRNATWQYPSQSYKTFLSPNEGGGFLSGDACYTPRLMAMQTLFGANLIADCSQFMEARYDDPRYVVPDMIAIWGCQPLASNSDGFYGHWIVDCMKRGSRLFVVDCRLTWLASRAEVWLQIRPGTDPALALGLLHVVINEKLYDADFVEKWCYGFEELRECVQEYTPRRVGEICGIEASEIEEAARKFAAASPLAMQWGLACDQSKHGVAGSHAIAALYSITGNVDIPGSNYIVNVGYVQNDIRRSVQRDVGEDVRKDRIGDDTTLLRKFGYAPHDLPDAILEALETDKPYPIKMMWVASTNTFANMGAAARRVYEAMGNAEFCVVTDCFITPTAAAYADIVLPIAFGHERNGMRGWWAPIRSITKVSQRGECKSDEDIIVAVGRKIRPESWPYEDGDDLINYCLQNLSTVPFKGTHDDLRQMVLFYQDIEYRKYEKGLLRPDGKPGFNTATGKIELFSTLFDDLELPPLPYYIEPTESPVSTPELMEKYPFVLTTGQRAYEFFHSEHRQSKYMREFHPDPIMEINPEDAAALGIEEGDWVLMENAHGQAKMKAHLHWGMKKGVVNGEHGWWFPERKGAEPELFGVFESNINCLTTAGDYGPTTYGAPYKAQICNVAKI